MEFKQIVNPSALSRILPKRSGHTSEADQVRLIKSWKMSQLSQAEFCKQNNINSKTFSNWLRKHRDSIESTSHEPMPKEACQLPQEDHMELKFPNGIQFRFTNLTPASTIRSFIKEIATCKCN